jgi:outer membrane protein assembly factor BamB
VPSRRDYLTGLGGLAATLGGCTGRSGPGTPTLTPTPKGTGTETRTGTATSTADPTDRAVPPDLSGSWTHPDAGARATRSTDTDPLDAVPDRLWTAELAGDHRRLLLAGDALYTSTGTGIARRSLADGAPTWRRSFDDRVRLGAALSDVYLTTGESDPRLRALAGEEGEPPAERRTREDVRFRRADADLVVAAANDSGRLYGLEPDGSGRWSLDVGDVDLGVDVEGDRFDSVAVGPERVFAAVESGGSVAWVAGIGRESGRVAWTDTGPNHAGLLTVTPDAVLSGGFHGKVFVWSHDGDLRWRARTTPPVGTVAFADGRAFASANADSAPAITALDGSGERLWTRASGTVLAVDAGAAYVADGEGLVALDAGTGERRWRLDTPATQVVPADGGLFVLGGTELRLFG